MRQFARTYRVRRTPMQRWAAKVRIPEHWKDEACWEWTGIASKIGYGQFIIKENGVWRRVGVHRYSYERFIGPIPPGLHLDHLCRNSRCVNPTHLEAVTCRENCLRGIAPSAKKARQTHCIWGHELNEKNTYHKSSHGRRACRVCHKVIMRARLAAVRVGRIPPTGEEMLKIMRVETPKWS
jgi:hypothetical protein